MKINSMLFKTITIYEDVLINLYYLNQLDVYRVFFLYISIQLSRFVTPVDDIDNDLVELESMGNPTTGV